jgi:hypothetical protein
VSDTVAAPIFTAATPNGSKDYGLFGLMTAATRGELIDLPEMAVQRKRRNAQDEERKHCSSHCGPPNVAETALNRTVERDGPD